MVYYFIHIQQYHGRQLTLGGSAEQPTRQDNNSTTNVTDKVPQTLAHGSFKAKI